MALSYFTPAAPSRLTTLSRTLYIWFFSNLGGTTVLTLDFGHDFSADLGVPLFIGLMAALLSLAYVPLALTFSHFRSGPTRAGGTGLSRPWEWWQFLGRLIACCWPGCPLVRWATC